MQPKASPRRVHVKGRQGIYYREAANGSRPYEITYVGTDGRRRWQTVHGGLKDAEAAREDVRARIRRGERVAPRNITFEAFARAWLQRQGHLRPRTRALYETQLRVHLLPRFGRRRLASIDEDYVAALIADMRAAGYSSWTIRACSRRSAGCSAMRRGGA